MPEYTYLDENKHMKKVIHRMLYSTGVVCELCGEAMWRMPPQGVAINWNGPSPSAGEMHPEVKELYRDVDKKRDAFRERHEQHEVSSN